VRNPKTAFLGFGLDDRSGLETLGISVKQQNIIPRPPLEVDFGNNGDSYRLMLLKNAETATRAFELYWQLPKGIKRAILIHFVVSEVHPFQDGTGRLSRIMMNAELASADLHKIIVPVVARDNYLNGLRQASRDRTFRTMVKVLHQLHRYTARIHWLEYDEARHTLECDMADKKPDDLHPVAS